MSRLRAYLPATPGAMLASALALLAGGVLAWRLAEFLVVDAAWMGPASACRAVSGFCWAFLRERGAASVYGFYPQAARWRLDLLLGLAALAGVLAVTARRRPVVPGLAACLAALCALTVLGGMFGAPAPGPAQLGGICLTLALSLAAIGISLPLGLLLALMRHSDMPVLRGIATIWIDLWRGLPTVVVLFFAVAAFPLLAPPGTEIDKVLRVLAAFTLLASALFAEAMRGGLRAIGAGQMEAARALHLGPLATLWRVVLPQMMAVATPNIVNVSIALIKETTLILVIGLYDLFGVIQAATVDPSLASGSVVATGYATAAAGYFLLCFGLSHATRRRPATLV